MRMEGFFFACLLFLAVAQVPTPISIQNNAPDTCDQKKPCSPISSSTVLIPSVNSFDKPTGYPDVGARLLISLNVLSDTTNLWFGIVNKMNGYCNEDGPDAGFFSAATPINGQNNVWFSYDPKALASTLLEFEQTPRRLCYRTGAAAPWQFSGFYWNVVWDCAPEGTVATSGCDGWGAHFDSDVAVVGVADNYLTRREYTNPQFRNMIAGRKVCCEGNAVINSAQVDIRIGQCIDANVSTCCGATNVQKSTEKCCNTQKEQTAPLAASCPCENQAGCPAGENCCISRKFSELASVPAAGSCYNPEILRCCNTGEIYDSGLKQCCSITGVQTLWDQCPCTSDTHCSGGQVDAQGRPTQITGQICCVQTAPAPPPTLCSIYANNLFSDMGTAKAAPASCTGRCIDPTYQLCCNGNSGCMQEIHRCCNATCCNKFDQTCAQGWFKGRAEPVSNGNDFRTNYDVCSSIEHLNPLRSFWVFLLPLVLLVGTLGSTALVLVFANKGAARGFSIVEKSLITVAVLAILLAIPLFFSPVYKYAVITILVQLFTIVTASARVKWLNKTAIVLQVILLLYYIDPFHGNAYVNLSSGRSSNGFPDPATAGILQSTSNRLWDLRRTSNTRFSLAQSDYCTSWYAGYFQADPALRDLVRFENVAKATFGYCSRPWITALLVAEGLLIILVLSQFVLAVVALLLRFKKDVSYNPVVYTAPIQTYVAPVATFAPAATYAVPVATYAPAPASYLAQPQAYIVN